MCVSEVTKCFVFGYAFAFYRRGPVLDRKVYSHTCILKGAAVNVIDENSCMCHTI